MNPELVGYVAAFLTTAAYLPQAVKVIRDKHTKSISLGMYTLMTGGIACWLAYGILIGSPSVMIANGVTLPMAAVILWMKLRHG